MERYIAAGEELNRDIEIYMSRHGLTLEDAVLRVRREQIVMARQLAVGYFQAFAVAASTLATAHALGADPEQLTAQSKPRSRIDRRLDGLETGSKGRSGGISQSGFPRSSLRGVSLNWLKNNKPRTWRQVPTRDHAGWIWLDENNTERLRFMRPGGSNPANSQWSRQANGYFRWQDANGNFLDVDGQVISSTHPSFQELTHILYEGKL